MVEPHKDGGRLLRLLQVLTWGLFNRARPACSSVRTTAVHALVTGLKSGTLQQNAGGAVAGSPYVGDMLKTVHHHANVSPASLLRNITPVTT